MRNPVVIPTDTKKAEFYGRNGWVKMSGLEVWLPYSAEESVIIWPRSSRGTYSPAMCISMKKRELESACLTVLEELVGLEPGQFTVVLEAAKYALGINSTLAQILDMPEEELEDIGHQLSLYMNTRVTEDVS